MSPRATNLALVVGLVVGLGGGAPGLAVADRRVPEAPRRWLVQSNQVQAFMGSSVDGAGDVNGDGYADLIVGAYQYDNGQTDEGRAYAYYGSPSGPSTTASWTAEANQASAYFGISLAGAGDVNGDGYDDVIVGASGYTNGESSEGRAFVYYGSASGLAATAGWTAESNQGLSGFGYSVSGAGDVNGDGYDDVMVGCLFCSNGQLSEGRAFVYYGSTTGPSTTPSWATESNEVNAEYGRSTQGAGDVDGDGYDDVLVGAPAFNGSVTDGGRAFLYRGSPAGLSTVAAWTADGDQAYSNFAVTLAGEVDVNADGYDDVLIGAPEFGSLAQGEAFAYYGSPGGLSVVPDWTIVGRQDYARFGGAASGAGDVNGDGFGDMAVGVWAFQNGQIEEGRVLIYCGTATGLPATQCRASESNEEQAFFGVSVGGAGDVDADGHDDLLVGATGFSNHQYGEGGAVLIYGMPG